MEAVLKFIYHGEVNVEEVNLESFLEVAKEVEVKGLVPDHGIGERGGSRERLFQKAVYSPKAKVHRAVLISKHAVIGPDAWPAFLSWWLLGISR